MNAQQAVKRATNLGLTVKIEGNPNYLTGSGASVFSQSLEKGTKVAKGTTIVLNFRHMEADEEPDYQ